MIVLLVHPATQSQHNHHIRQHQQVEPYGGDRSVDDDLPEIADEQVDRVEQKQALDRIGVLVDGVKNRGHIHQKLGEHGPEVLDIPEKHEQRRQDQSHADVEQDQTAGRVQQQDELPGEGDAVQNAEQEKHAQRQSEVDQSLDVLGQQEQVLRHVDLGEDVCVFQKRCHPQDGGLAEAGKDQVAAEQIGGIVFHRSAEKPGKDQPHHQQRQQRGEQAPRHAQHRSFVLFLEIALYQFLKQELVFFQLLYHGASLRFLP